MKRAKRVPAAWAAMLALVAAASAGCGGGNAEPPANGSRDHTPAVTKPVYGSFGVDLSARKAAVKPGDDFFAYANGTWLDTFRSPPTKPPTGWPTSSTTTRAPTSARSSRTPRPKAARRIGRAENR